MNEGVKAILTWFESLVVVESCVTIPWAMSKLMLHRARTRKQEIDTKNWSNLSKSNHFSHSTSASPRRREKRKKALNNRCEWKNGGQSSLTTDISSAGRKQVKHIEEEGKVGLKRIHIVHIQLVLTFSTAANFRCRSYKLAAANFHLSHHSRC